MEDLTFDDLDAVEEAEAAYEGLSAEDKAEVNPTHVTKLNELVPKIAELVLEDVDEDLIKQKKLLTVRNWDQKSGI